ncbi:MAG: HAD family hydrolase [Chloroflexi bacterium]|nr:HAD family hydrolase [Chloroflexota bacterium]MQC25655.1 HAD family hydrolase [Chloroflexota bacterium]MQC48490.1 HAD family hydrolase [Chloroflexota bacterium]
MIHSGRTVRAALFDLDGTLVDSLPTIAEAMSKALAMHGHQVAPRDIVPFIGPPMNVMARDLAHVDDATAEVINADYLRIYHHEFISQTPARAGADVLVRGLHAAGLTLGVVTNKVEAGGHLMLEIMGWTDLFSYVAGRETSEPKPHPEAALHVLRTLGVPPAEAVLVGDTEFDMRCGRAAGLAMTIGITGSRTAADLRTRGATHVVKRLDEVGGLLLGAGARA